MHMPLGKEGALRRRSRSLEKKNAELRDGEVKGQGLGQKRGVCRWVLHLRGGSGSKESPLSLFGGYQERIGKKVKGVQAG